jgi:CRP-like cAMP-binding protein
LELCYNRRHMPEEHDRLHPAFLQVSIFEGLSSSEIEAVSSHFQLKQLDDDTFLFHEDEEATIFYLLLEGQVKIQQTTAEGFEVILHILGPGNIIGALPTLGEGTYPASALTLGKVFVAFTHAEVFHDILEQYPRLTKNLLRFATRVVQTSHRKIRELATERVEQRIARALSRLASQLGRQTEGGILLDFPLSRQDLAEMTGTTVFTVSRTLKQWERRGVLQLGRERIVIHSPHELIAIGEDLPS